MPASSASMPAAYVSSDFQPFQNFAFFAVPLASIAGGMINESPRCIPRATEACSRI
jgi:hypothetical protein